MSAVLFSTGEQPSSQLRSEIAALNRIQDESFQAIVDIIFNFLLASKQPDAVLERLTELSGEIGISVGALKSVVRSLLTVLKGAGGRGIAAKNIQQDLSELGTCVWYFKMMEFTGTMHVNECGRLPNTSAFRSSWHFICRIPRNNRFST